MTMPLEAELCRKEYIYSTCRQQLHSLYHLTIDLVIRALAVVGVQSVLFQSIRYRSSFLTSKMGSISETSAVEARIGKLAADIDALSKDVAYDPALQKQLYGVVMGAMTKVEAPMDTIWRMSTLDICTI